MKNGDYNLVKAPKDFQGIKYRGKYCLEHHYVYCKEYHVVPKDNEVIHHIDGNKQNNNIKNLKLMTREEHVKIHHKKKTYVKLKCVWCQKVFVREKRETHLSKHQQFTCCSRQCSAKAIHLKQKNIEEFQKRIKENVVEVFEQ